jgi:hypothetical protein
VLVEVNRRQDQLPHLSQLRCCGSSSYRSIRDRVGQNLFRGPLTHTHIVTDRDVGFPGWFGLFRQGDGLLPNLDGLGDMPPKSFAY